MTKNNTISNPKFMTEVCIEQKKNLTRAHFCSLSYDFGSFKRASKRIPLGCHTVGYHAALSTFIMRMVTITFGFYSSFPSVKEKLFWQLIFNKKYLIEKLLFKSFKNDSLTTHYKNFGYVFQNKPPLFPRHAYFNNATKL